MTSMKSIRLCLPNTWAPLHHDAQVQQGKDDTDVIKTLKDYWKANEQPCVCLT